MRRALKLAVVVGGIGALAWGMRKRFRIAIGRGEAADPDFHIIDPVSESTTDEMPAEEISDDVGEDDGSQTSSDDDPLPPSGVSNGGS